MEAHLEIPSEEVAQAFDGTTKKMEAHERPPKGTGPNRTGWIVLEEHMHQPGRRKFAGGKGCLHTRVRSQAFRAIWIGSSGRVGLVAK
jgi:hypothetical protein